MDLKYDILKHPNIKLSADGGAEPYDHTRPNYSIGSFRFDRDVLKLEPFEVTDEVGDFAILTEEEIEEILKKEKMEEKIMKKTHPKKNTAKLPLPYKVRKGFSIYCAIVLVVALMFTMSMTAFAANDDPLTVVNNLSDFIFGLIRAIGLIMLGFGIVQVGLSLKSHDPSQRANGFLTVAGGIVITFAKEILNLITG